MCKIHIVGNPNSGKNTLFNSITKSSEHVGNWHGVTVDRVSKLIKFKNNTYELIDLPGIYSLNAYSLEEQVSIDEINSSDCNKILYLIDANNFKRGMLLALNLLIRNKNIKILINNYNSFSKSGGEIDTNYLQKVLGCEVEIINAQKFKPKEDFFNFVTRKTAFITTLQNELSLQENFNNTNNITNTKDNKNNITDNKKFKKNNLKYKNIEILYKYILKIANNCVKNKNQIYGYSKFDNKLLKLSVFLPIFVILMFGVIYITFFLIGPIISGWFLNILYIVIQKPVMAILNLCTKSRFLIALFDEGIFGACFSVLGFLPQICLMYLFLSIFEHSGLISRMAFLFDDALEKVGLNGKMVYTLLMGFGCSTTATITAKNMTDKNAQIKASLLTPFVSCSAKLPIYTTLGLALLGIKSVGLIFGLYLLGIVMAIVFAIIFERTILPSRSSQLVLEFPPLQKPKFCNIFQSLKISSKQFVTKVFGVIFGASLILWLLSNVDIHFQYVGDTTRSILYSFSTIISWAFKPIGLDNPSIICALLVGLVAKELILSTFAISNKVSNSSMLGASLVVASSAVNFNLASGISFLVFTLLYFPCISNLGVMLKTIGTKYTLVGVCIQLALAYLMSYVIYNLLTKGVTHVLVVVMMLVLVIVSVKIIYKKIKLKKIFCNCIGCNKCEK